MNRVSRSSLAHNVSEDEVAGCVSSFVAGCVIVVSFSWRRALPSLQDPAACEPFVRLFDSDICLLAPRCR